MKKPMSANEAAIKVFDELLALPKEELIRQLDEHGKKMDEARKNGEFSWGNTIWYAMDPDGYNEQLKKDEQEASALKQPADPNSSGGDKSSDA